MIAREFGYSETVFLHDAPGPGQPRRCDIFTGHGEELPFAGHPVSSLSPLGRCLLIIARSSVLLISYVAQFDGALYALFS
jgi:hypothetical protein